MLAHKASHEAAVAIDAICDEPASFRPLAVPAVVFTDPEIAWCGLNESEAAALDIDAAALSFPWTALGRANASGRSEGLTRVVFERGSERVLGVRIVGAGAGELIGEGVLAVELGARAADLAESIHAHPTLSRIADGGRPALLRPQPPLHRPPALTPRCSSSSAAGRSIAPTARR